MLKLIFKFKNRVSLAYWIQHRNKYISLKTASQMLAFKIKSFVIFAVLRQSV